MKLTKDFPTKVSKIVLSISVLLVCSSLFIFSINNLKANETTTSFDFPDKLTQQDKNFIQNSSRYRMEITTHKYPNSDYVYVLVYDTQSGNSKIYFIDGVKPIKALPANYQLPSSPL